ncbi:hypothetical protein [Ligilactobacillus agilis]|uniref:hypothetical protein n=1 Tax=Ligilactobacillus agilis TaxID=1601 RepID=UPI0018696477|nr:hypothetical protein [Ligilactobacillus agilis]
MKKKILTVVKCCLIIFSFIATAFNTVTSIVDSIRYHNLVINWLSLMSIAPLTFALYQEIDFIYVWCNKIMSFFKNKTVNFKVSFYLQNNSDNFVNVINNNLNKVIKDCHLSFDNGSPQRFSNDMYTKFYFVTNNNLKFSVAISNDNLPSSEIETNNFSIIMDFQISYRDTSDCWELCKKFREKFTSKLVNENERIDLNINLSNSNQNPFYRLTVKYVSANKIDDFRLAFSEKESLKVTLNKHSIYATSVDIQDLDRVVKEYIPLSSVN